jgi:GGDEF domain-containing protein
MVSANVELIVIHTVTFGIVGILGGEVCSRIKYFFVRLEGAFNIDESSNVYNQRFASQVLRTQIAQHLRYGTEFSLSLLTLSPALTAELRPVKVSTLIRTAANHIRDDVRLVDDVGRLDDGRFILLFPHTPKDGAVIAAERVCRGVRDVLGAKDESVTCELYGVPEDIDAIRALADALSAPYEETGTEG